MILKRWRLLVFLAAGLGLVIAIKSKLDRPPPVAERMDDLHSDEEIRRLAPHDIEASTKTARSFADVPHLEIVPAGESRPRGEVFRALGISDQKLRDFRTRPSDHVLFLFWQISPSYDIVCMSGNTFREEALPDDDARRKVYGIRLVSRADGSHIWW
jgi:hypothetical protein